MRVSNQSKRLTTNAAHFAQKDGSPELRSQNQIKIQVINPRDKGPAEGAYSQNSFTSLHYPDLEITNNKQGNEMNGAQTLDSSQIVRNDGSAIRSSNTVFTHKRSQYKKDESNNKMIPPSPEYVLSRPPYLLTKNLSSQTQKPQFIENSKLLLDVSFNSSHQDKEQPIEIDGPCPQIEEFTIPKTQQELVVTELRKTGRLCESFADAGNKFEEKKSNSKMKLRDYLYMTHTSSKKASLEKHELIEKRKSPVSSLVSQTASQTHSSTPKQFQSPQSSSISRESATPKYQLSNGKMFQILKRQICQSLHSIHEILNKTEVQLQDVESFDKQPTNEQLLLLCNMRREIKEQAEKQLATVLESLVKSKRNNLLESRSKRQSKSGTQNDINFDQFSKNSQ